MQTNHRIWAAGFVASANTMNSTYTNGYYVTMTTSASDALNVTETTMTNYSNVSLTGAVMDDTVCRVYDLIIEAVAMGLLCCFGFVGNILSMICLWKDKSKTATPFLLVSLEIADTLFLLCVLPLRVISTICQYTGSTVLDPVTPYLAKYVFPLAIICETGTIYMTLLVTINRYISVCRPYSVGTFCTVRNSHRHVFGVWLFAWLYNIPRFFHYDIVDVYDAELNSTRKVVAVTSMAQDEIYQYFYCNLMYCVVMFLVPLITLCVLNYKLVHALRKTKRKRKLMISHENSSRSEDDITLILIVVVVVFVISQTPALVTQLLLVSLPPRLLDCAQPFFFYERISDLLVVFNSAINFLIYCFCSRRFRHILCSTVCTGRSGAAGGSPETSMRNGHTRNNRTKYTTLTVRNGHNGNSVHEHSDTKM